LKKFPPPGVSTVTEVRCGAAPDPDARYFGHLKSRDVCVGNTCVNMEKMYCPEGCGQAFANTFSMKRHVEKMACPMLKTKLAQDENLRREHRINQLSAQHLDTRQLLEHVVRLEAQVAAQEERIAANAKETRERLDSLEKMLVPRIGTGHGVANANANASMVINNTNNINININANSNNNITINVLGKEDHSHLTPELLERCIKMAESGVLEMVRKIHFNPDKPENHNVRITSIKDWQSGLIQFRQGDDWDLTDKSVYRNMWLGGWKPLNRVWGDWECDGVTQEKLARVPNAFKVESFMETVEGICARMNIRAKPDATDTERAEVQAKIDRAHKDLRKIYFKPMEALLRSEYLKRKKAEAEAKKAGAGALPGPPPSAPVQVVVPGLVAAPAPVVTPAPHAHAHDEEEEEEEDLDAFMAQSLTESESESEREPDSDAEPCGLSCTA
jgi:hypothetical protein